MYKVKTKQGQVYNRVKSWKKWNLNESFVQFEWGDNKIFIIHFDDIEYIDMV